MKLCIPITENKFLASEISAHFGKAPAYLVVESVGHELCGVIERGARGAGTCAPVEAILERGVEAVVCAGLGRGAFERLTAGGIRVYRTEEATVESALWALEGGGLKEYVPADLCAGHSDHPHDHHPSGSSR